MKKIYSAPQVEVCELLSTDIICTSVSLYTDGEASADPDDTLSRIFLSDDEW